MLDRERSISSTGIPDGDEHPPWVDGGEKYGPANPTTYVKDIKAHMERDYWDHEAAGQPAPPHAHERDAEGKVPLGRRVDERKKREQGFSYSHEETKTRIRALLYDVEKMGLEVGRIVESMQWMALDEALRRPSLRKTAEAMAGCFSPSVTKDMSPAELTDLKERAHRDKHNVHKTIRAAMKALERAVRGRR